MRSLVPALFAALLLAGCYTGPPATADHKPEHVNARMMPLGWVAIGSGTPSPETGAIGGLFAVRRQRSYCCWMGSEGRLGVRVPAHARTVLLTVFVPDLPAFAERRQSLTASVDGGAVRRFDPLPLGVSFLRIPLRPAGTAHVAAVVLHAGFTFSPKKTHLNGDGRELSIYVKSVRAE